MKTETREQVVSRILTAAVDCILEYGIDDVQITQIAAAAGLSSRTLSRYYPEKEALLADAAAQYLGGVYEKFLEGFAQTPTEGLSGREKLLMFLRLQRDYFQTQTLEAMLMIDMRFYRIRHSNAPTSWKIAGGEAVRELVVDCVEKGISDGSIRGDIDPSLTSALISGTYNGVMQRLTMTYRAIMPEDEKQRLYSAFDNYIDMADRYLRP